MKPMVCNSALSALLRSTYWSKRWLRGLAVFVVDIICVTDRIYTVGHFRRSTAKMNRLREWFAPHWRSFHATLFPALERELGPLTDKQQQLVQILEIIRIEDFLPPPFRVPGRPAKDRACIARAFVAKAVYDMPTTRILLDRLVTDVPLRRVCGWE